MKRYNPKEIEPKWQKIWQATGVYTVDLESDKPKYVSMSMFNYPSGDLHIGHAMNYTISDIKARFKRQQGFESYHPVGWDSFGLPAENYAIKAGISPQESMADLIPNYREKYKAMGWSNDWEKEIATHTPEYYKWTQWLFIKMHEAGLAYQDSREQWWCTKCQTILADAQVIDGKCWRHDSEDDLIVEKKEIKQWFFKITEYADELLEATKDLDWTPSVKLAQQNWIGKSEGAEIEFETEGSHENFTAFTTALDTIYGVTFMVLAPEHNLVQQITTDENQAEVEGYIKNAAKKTEIERQANKEKTGVFTGAFVKHPLTDEKIPVWVADYVLVDYGTGAIMAVPGEDERDYEFAQKYELPIVYTTKEQEFVDYQDIKASPEKYELANSGEFDGINFAEAKKQILDKLIKIKKAKKQINYKMRDWSVARQRYWGAPVPVINCQKCGPVILKEKDLPVILPELVDFKPSGDGRSALARAKDWLEVDCPDCGGKAERETDTLDTYVCSSWYMMRYLDPHSQQEAFDKKVANNWMPVDFYNGGDHATAHLLYVRFVARFLSKQGYLDNPEPFENFLFNGKLTAQDGTMFSKTKGNGVDPMEIINQGYGADALRTFLMFAGPLEQWIRWNPQGVPGTHRFLTRLWNLTQEFLESEKVELSENETVQLQKFSAKTAKKVEDDLESSHYNTAIAACMAGLNDLYKHKETAPFGQNEAWQSAIETIVMCVAPFAPHMADELWQQLGHSDSVHKDHWPKIDKSLLVDDTVTIVIQVNGKVRANLQSAKDTPKDELIELAKKEDNVASYIEDKEIKKTIVVPNKIVSFVV